MPETFNSRDTDRLWKLEREMALIKRQQELDRKDIEDLQASQGTTDKFITVFQTTETIRDKQHKENRNRLNVIIGVLTALCAILALFHH